MKTLAIVNGNDFRTMVKAALSVTVKRSATGIGESILIKACDNVLYICGNTFDQMYRGQCKCDCDGTFEVTVNEYTAKKIVNIKGNNITITYDSDDDKKIKMTDGKKTMELNCFTPSDNDFNYDSYTCMLEKDRSTVFTVDAEELLDGIKTVAPFRSFIDAKPILQGFNFNGETGHLETIDGYRCIRKSWKTLERQSNYNMTVQQQLENIKNVFDKSGKITVAVTTDNKLTVFTKTDYGVTAEYGVRNYEGSFHPIKDVIPKSFTTVIKVDNAELTEVVKEYKGYVNAKHPEPMYIGGSNGELYTAVFASDITTSDKLSAKIDGNTDIVGAYKINFILDTLKVFGKNEISINYNSELAPILITDGEYECLNLPVRVKPEYKEKFKTMIA